MVTVRGSSEELIFIFNTWYAVFVNQGLSYMLDFTVCFIDIDR